MADEEKKGKPKRRPCAVTRKNMRRIDWYYRDGEYFLNKSTYKTWKAKKIEEQKKAEEEARQAAAEAEKKQAEQAETAEENAEAAKS
jgi:uncharacterized protein YdaU (DUF1376 family)